MSNPIALYQIADRFKALETLADQEDLAPEIVADTLDGIEAEFDEKAIAVAAYIRTLEHSADGIAEAAKAMQARAARLKKRAESLSAYLLFQMSAMNKQKIQHDLFTLSLRKNPPSVVIDDENQIPDEYWREPEPVAAVPDRKAIADAIKAGKEVPGCHTLQTERVEIKA